MARKLTTSVTEEDYKYLMRLKREDINVSDVIRVAIMLHAENPELFYSFMYRISKQKEVRKVRV